MMSHGGLINNFILRRALCWDWSVIVVCLFFGGIRYMLGVSSILLVCLIFSCFGGFVRLLGGLLYSPVPVLG